MKKKASVTFVACIVFSLVFAACVYAAEGTDKIAININGNFLETDQPPVIENGRTLVPLRAIGEALGCEVDWKNETKTAIFVQGAVKAEITVGESVMHVGDGVYNEEVPVDTPATIINSRTMIPLRALSEGFGYDVNWDAQTKTVTINSKLMSDKDTSSANEQDKIETPAANLSSSVLSYANILAGTTKIIDAVDYKDEDYENLKAEINEIIEEAESKTYEELVAVLTRLKEIDDALSQIAADAGVSDIVAEYYAPLIEPLKDILNN